MSGHARRYDDFDLQIRADRDGVFEAAILRSPAGEVRRIFIFPLTKEALAERLLRLETIATGRTKDDGEGARAFGGLLFGAVFAEGVLQAYDQSRTLAGSRGHDLRIRLRVLDDPLLAALPWELLYDPRQGCFVALQQDTVLVRTLETLQPRKALAVAPPLRVLALAAQPADLAALDVERERRHLAAGLARLGDGAVLQWVEGQTWRDLQDALQRGSWHVFHFLGHGVFDPSKGEGFLIFAGEDGTADPRPAGEVARLLGDQDLLRLAVLNACQGAQDGGSHMDVGIAQQLVRAGVPAVVAMQYAISGAHAAELTRSFYGALGNGLAVDAALAEARKALSLAAPEGIAWSIPVLVLREGEETAPAAEAGLAQRLQVSRRLALAILAILVVIGAALLVGLPFLAGKMEDLTVAFAATATPAPTATATATATPYIMPANSFNIAVSEFEASDRTGSPVEFADAREIPAAIRRNIERNEELKQQIGDIFADRVSVADVDSGLPPMRHAAAAEFAQRVGADVVVFGSLRQLTDNQWEVQPKFYVHDSVFARAPEFLGEITLGPPLTYRASNRADRGGMISAIGERTEVLARLLVGLSQYDINNDAAYAAAAATFERILTESAWAKRADAEGLEIVHYFIGLSYLLHASAAEQQGDVAKKAQLLGRAKEYFEQGLALNADSARLHSGLASVEFQLLSSEPDCSAQEDAALQQIEEHLHTALALVDASRQVAPHIQVRAHLYLGRIEWQRGVCRQDPVSQAGLDHFLEVVRLYRAGEEAVFRNVAMLAYGHIGVLLQAAKERGESDRLRVDPALAAADPAEHFRQAIVLAAALESEASDQAAATYWIPLHLLALCSAERSGEMAAALEQDVGRFKDKTTVRATAVATYTTYENQAKECLDAVTK